MHRKSGLNPENYCWPCQGGTFVAVSSDSLCFGLLTMRLPLLLPVLLPVILFGTGPCSAVSRAPDS